MSAVKTPPTLRAEAFRELENGRTWDRGAWPRRDIEDAYARAQVFATLAVEEQVQRLRLALLHCAVCVLIGLLSILIVVVSP